jgi:hypothetical protein
MGKRLPVVGDREGRAEAVSAPALLVFRPKTEPGHRSRAIVVEGVLYPRVVDAERERDLPPTTLRRWLRDPRRTDCYYVDERPE